MLVILSHYVCFALLEMFDSQNMFCLERVGTTNQTCVFEPLKIHVTLILVNGTRSVFLVSLKGSFQEIRVCLARCADSFNMWGQIAT